jgi:ribosomal protein L29
MEEFKKKTDEDLRKMLAEKRESLRKFRFEMAGARVKNTKEGRNLKTAIAQIVFELSARASAPKAA